MIPVNWYIALSFAVFCIGMFGFIVRRNIIVMLICIELMLNGVNISLIAFSHYLEDLAGQILVFLVIAVSASEAAIGLALVILIFRHKEAIYVDELNNMKW
ncbi:NADH:ubiquinone/quinone oxidoreductase, chain 4L [Candidatus Magnetoovum chiemensis]|nr:NADH:ubiquinone/quinone oxidoreductase, chain 4L [Candidatus Magnetoovum chiemensis]